MKSIKLVCAIAAITGFVAAGSAFAQTSGGQITFTGVVSDSSCVISGGPGTGGGGGNFSVALDPVSNTVLAAPGAVANPKTFVFRISDGSGTGECADGTIATVSFNPVGNDPIDPTTGNLTNTLAGESNVQVQLLNDAGTAINLFNPNNSVVSNPVTGGIASIQMQAQYYAKTATTTPGQFNSTLRYTVVYN
ncbi:type 1 fimbrial protein [Dyella monticola]|uniref:Type 1 fimbrial protein n=1 Tax=Dyella monticola TaxID=1927958 RepID=A0A370X2Y1_9GAMM|nr:fimbrial protein [Dyella monticola]RDS82774.1 type 1 fimbrial protein [Dyella monticola]